MAIQIFLWIRQRWRLLFLLLVPLVLLPLPIVVNSSQGRCGYIILILISYWISEVIPLSVTSILPLFFFPMAGLLKADKVAEFYFQDIIALFFGSLSLAYAIEYVNLHRRIALLVLSRIGTSTKWSMAGLMGVTAFLSMWINNSSATSIMLPVAIAITDELERYGKESLEKKRAIQEATSAVNEVLDLTKTEVANGHTTVEVILDTFHIEEPKTETDVKVQSGFLPWRRRPPPPLVVVKPHEQKYVELKKGFLLATAYSASIGGLSSLVGTTPNIYLKGFVDDHYTGTGFSINFLNFLLMALPVAVLMLIFCWIWLQLAYNRREFFQCRQDDETRESQAKLKAMLVEQYKSLGSPSWSEYSVLIVFILVVILWLTQEFGDTRGWDIIFQKDYISEGTVAVFCGMLPLILPNSNPFKINFKYAPIVTWSNLSKNIPWGVLFLLGAGLAVADAFEVSGLSKSVAEALRFLSGINRTAVVFIIILISGLFTEVTSNLSTASIFFPILDSIATTSGIHPAYLILPCTLAVSLAFMLPIASPPNTIIFSSGIIRVVDMVKAGVVIKIIGFLLTLLASTTWMPKIFNLDELTAQFFANLNTTTTATG